MTALMDLVDLDVHDCSTVWVLAFLFPEGLGDGALGGEVSCSMSEDRAESAIALRKVVLAEG